MERYKARVPAWRKSFDKTWPHVRAALILVHIVGICLLSLPWTASMADRSRWQHPQSQKELQSWATLARSVGIRRTDAELQDLLWTVASGYLHVRAVITWPFNRYAACCGTGQGWQMFAAPQRRPGHVSVDIEENGDFRTVYRSRSDQYDWRRGQFDHNRLRKSIGRIYRPSGAGIYDDLVPWLAKQAARDFPQATRIRVRQHIANTLPAAAARKGEQPDTFVSNERIVDLGARR